MRYLFPFVYCRPVTHPELSVPIILIQRGAVVPAKSKQHSNHSASLSSTALGQDFTPPQLRNKIGVVEIRYVLALGAFSLHIGRGRRCGGGWLAQRPFLGWLLPTQVPRHRHMKKCLFWQKRGLCPCLMSWWHFRDLHRGYEFHTYHVQIHISSTLVETWRTTMTTATRRNAQVETHPSLGGLRIQPWELDSLGLAPIFGPQTIVKL